MAISSDPESKTEYLWRQKNKAHLREYHKKWLYENRERVKAYRRKVWHEKIKPNLTAEDKMKIRERSLRHFFKNKYNITLDEKHELEKSQGFKCKICNKEKRLVIDHCHKTNKIRGMLCSECNVAIGLFYENIDSIKNAADYLQKTK